MSEILKYGSNMAISFPEGVKGLEERKVGDECVVLETCRCMPRLERWGIMFYGFSKNGGKYKLN